MPEAHQSRGGRAEVGRGAGRGGIGPGGQVREELVAGNKEDWARKGKSLALVVSTEC